MYQVRHEARSGLIDIELSGRLPTHEALRAMNHAFTCLEASHLTSMRCDVTGVTAPPGGLLVLAAALAMRFQPGSRISFVVSAEQLPILERLIRFSGIQRGMRAFDSRAQARRWLQPARAQRSSRALQAGWSGAPALAPPSEAINPRAA